MKSGLAAEWRVTDVAEIARRTPCAKNMDFYRMMGGQGRVAFVALSGPLVIRRLDMGRFTLIGLKLTNIRRLGTVIRFTTTFLVPNKEPERHTVFLHPFGPNDIVLPQGKQHGWEDGCPEPGYLVILCGLHRRVWAA